MSKKKGGRSKKRTKALSNPGVGLELGAIPRVLLASDSVFDFNRQLVEANVYGFAYGFDRVEGYPSPVPCLSLIAEKPAHLELAFKYFEHWGSQVDGDSVDMTIVLRKSGTYLLGIQPNAERMIYRLVKDTALAETIYPGMTWIKTVDTTNPILWDWKEHLESKMLPIVVHAATAQAIRGIPQTETVQPIVGAPSFTKFGLVIVSEDEEPDHWFFDIISQSRGEKPRRRKAPKNAPSFVAAARRRLIDTVFPVTRERVRRRNLGSECRAILGSDLVSDAQVEQAAINVMLSQEWCNGAEHFVGMKDVHEQWWKRLQQRVEIAGSKNAVEEMDAEIVAKQVQLDVGYTLRQHGVALTEKFSTNQKAFTRLGYAGT
jgi:hypothetical protein